MSDFTISTLKYVRPDFEELAAFSARMTQAVTEAKTYEELKKLMAESQTVQDALSTACTIASVRHTLDTTDPFYEEENRVIENAMPALMPSFLALNAAIVEGPFRAELEREYGKQFFVEKELEKKRFCEANIPLMQREAELTNEYQKIMATAAISFHGETYNLYGMQKFFEHEDRTLRRDAIKAYSEFYHGHEARLEEIWAELIDIRNEMGRNLGFENFIPLGYLQQGRTDYGQEEVASFRAQVREVLVPLCKTLYEAQQKRLGLDELMCYDEKRLFPDGNAIPAGDDDFLVAQAQAMYHDLSPETAEFIDFMIDHELMELKNKPGKAYTGYQTSLLSYKAPFVFSCFNGTIGDIGVLTHELGHAFAAYLAMRNQPISDLYSPYTDICEIHSMSMEQFSYPYAQRFFGDQADKFRFAHLQESITFVPFGVAVDEFQHICYANPHLTPRERTLEWKKLEEIYMPWRKYDVDDFYDRGGYWYHKLHIFLYPFYYINYTLTTMGAMEFKKKNHENPAAAWADYLNLCKCGGSLSYLEALRHANLSNPFAPGTVASAMAIAEEEILNSKFMQ